MTDAELDVCPECDDPWCSCGCAMCDFVVDSHEAEKARAAHERRCARNGIKGAQVFRSAERGGLDGRALRIRYYKSLVRK